MCIGCHGNQGTGAYKINIEPYYYGTLDLFAKIDQTMPAAPYDSSSCVGQCAADIAAFMKTWQVNVDTPALACDNGSGLTYGARQLKLLTRSEYQSSVEDLVGINLNVVNALPSDTRVHGYANNLNTVVSQVHQDAYFETANKIASWISEIDPRTNKNRWSNIVSCDMSDKTACIDDFVNNFAKKAFRRPLTKGEITAFSSLFGDNFTDGSVQAGLEMAVTATLMSPAFLYRSEQGTPVSVGEHDGNGYEFVSVTESLTAMGFGDKRHYVPGAIEGSAIVGDTTNSRQQGKLGKHFSYTGSGTLMQFSLRGLPAEGTIPVVKYYVSGQEGSITVDWEDFRTISLYFPGLSGHSEMMFFVDPSPARVEFHEFKYGPGQAVANAPDRDAYVLTPYEVATYLAYTFTGSTPDAQLMTAADNNLLSSDEQIAAQVDRLLNTPRAKLRLGDFAAQWAGTDLALTQPKDIMIYKEEDINDTLRAAMAQEVRELFTHTLTSKNFKEFFATDYAFVNKPLAEHYNLSGADSAESFSKVNGNGERGGIFTTAAFHVAYGAFEETHPIIRAARVREKFLCQHVPPPPMGIAVGRMHAEERIASIIAELGYVTTRIKTDLLTQSEGCNSCHAKIINPLGFGLEDYDTVGRYQQQDRHGAPIDASGILYGITGLPSVDPSQFSFYGGKGLGEVLANSEVAYQCFVENAFRFAVGVGSDVIDVNNPSGASLTEQEKADNSCSVKGITEHMIQSDYDPRVVLKSLGTMKLVRYRKELNR